MSKDLAELCVCVVYEITFCVIFFTEFTLFCGSTTNAVEAYVVFEIANSSRDCVRKILSAF